MITFKCPACSHEIKVKAEYAGKNGRCKTCGETVRVPVDIDYSANKNELVLSKPYREPELVVAKPIFSPERLQSQEQVVYVHSPNMHLARIVVVLASVVGMASNFMPWITMPIIGSISGARGDGWFAFAMFALCVFLSISGNRIKNISMVGVVFIILASIGCIALGSNKIHLFNNIIDDPYDRSLINVATQIGIGLYVMIAAAIINIAAILLFNRE